MSNQFTTDLQNVEMWPVKAKGKVDRLNPLGDPKIEKYYHTALEQGRFSERNIADAQNWLLQKKKDLMEKINLYTSMNNLAIDGKLSTLPRSIKYVGDSIQIVKGIVAFQQEIIGLISAVVNNIGILQMIEANMVGMVQQNLNSLALALNEICNWGLPDLPAIPNLFSDTIWHWNGFNFVPIGAFRLTASSLKFDTNFAFNQCVVHLPNINIFQNYPTSVPGYSGLTYGTQLFVPPLGGLIPNTGQDLGDPNFIKTMQNTQGAVFLPPSYAATNTNLAAPFNVNSSMIGAVPDPRTIISDYHMPSDTYRSNIVSIVPALTSQTVEPSALDYLNPNLAIRQPELRKALEHYVTLKAVVDSNYDPNLTACWLFYMDSARNGRLGSWIQNFQVSYVQNIQPSITYLANNPTPWNAVLPSDKVNNAPTAIPLILTLMTTDTTTQGNLLWQLSYLEASLLGYTRSQDWDAYASPNYVGSFTGTDLDYTATSIDSTTTTTLTLGEGTAEYPTPCTFPSSIGNTLQAVIDTATINIQNDPTYTSPRPQYNFIYNQFGVATTVDRFTQFWRTFNANLQALLLQDPFLVSFVVSYPEALDSAVDPLGDPTIYNQIKSDAATRSRSWVPGYPLLNIPVAPNVASSTTATPTNDQNGWTGNSFDPNVFLQRPDIQQLPISVQIAMLRTNLNYATVQQQGADISTSIQAAITQQQQLLQDFTNVGWFVESLSAANAIPVGMTGAYISFDETGFDLTGNVTSADKFTAQATGTYALAAEIYWAEGDAGYRIVNLILNDSTVITTASSTVAAPTTVQISVNQYLNKGDVLQVQATHGLGTSQFVTAGSYLSATITPDPVQPVYINLTPPSTTTATTSTTTTTPAAPSLPPSDTSSTLTFTADTALTPLAAVMITSDGNVAPIDPTVVTVDSSGQTIYPIPSGVTLSSAIAKAPITVGTNYGGIYQLTGSKFTVGGLLYAGAEGVLTQNYPTIVSTCKWVVVVGRALTSDKFLYEPHIPYKTASVSNIIPEVPAGVVNGTNTLFTLTQAPVSMLLFVNGVFQVPGVDYTMASPTSFNFTNAPQVAGGVADSLFAVISY